LDAQKKTLYAREQDPLARQAFRQRLATVAAEDIIVIDECGSNLNLTPRYARAPCGQRAIGYVPRNTPPNTTLIASLTLDGLGPAMILPGATDRLAFEAYIEHFLVPTLRPGQIVILDNLSAHRGVRVHQLVAARQCELWFLPSYSPDLSPIEPAFAKLKQAWRKAAARTLDALYETISTSLPSITSDDAQSFFTNCGYQPARTS
jgi:transposase